MNNFIECQNCKTQNPSYRFVCSNCKSYIRERVINIDFWKTFWKTFESPVKTFYEIIFAEHKNYIFYILFLISLKLSFNSLVLLNIFNENANITNDTTLNLYYLLISYFIIFISYSILLKLFFSLFKIKSRILDNLAILLYSQTPLLFSLFFIFPVQLGVFGIHWLIANPEPVMIKPIVAYALYGLDGILTIWGLVHMIIAHFVQTRNILLSIFLGLFFYLVITGLFIVFPFIQS